MWKYLSLMMVFLKELSTFYADLAIFAGSGSVGAPNTTTVFITEEDENPPSLIGRLFVDVDHLQGFRQL